MTTREQSFDRTVSSTPVLVYFSGVSENTKTFVSRLGFDAHRLPLRRGDDAVVIRQPYILVTPTYGGGEEQRTIPKQVLTFLNDPVHRAMCVGVVGGGNRNFGNAYILAARKLAALLNVPVIFDFEVIGTDDDVHEASQRINALWATLVRSLSARGFMVTGDTSKHVTATKTEPTT